LSKIKLNTTRVTKSVLPSQGTLRWMSPEQIEFGKVSKATDVYSFGMTIYEVQ